MNEGSVIFFASINLAFFIAHLVTQTVNPSDSPILAVTRNLKTPPSFLNSFGRFLIRIPLGALLLVITPAIATLYILKGIKWAVTYKPEAKPKKKTKGDFD